jgi:hypothetical protein
MKPEEREQAKADLAEICRELGCSGLNLDCPGNPFCEIIRKVVVGANRRESEG